MISRENTVAMNLEKHYIVDKNGCWIWQRATTNDGYAQVHINNRICYVHVLLWERRFGKKPTGKELDHLCRVRNCINTEHLELVTRTENVRRGKKVVLTMEKVREIRKEYRRGNGVILSKRYGVTSTTIYNIIDHKIWKE